LEVGQYRGMPMVEHSGSTGGYRTDIARFPSLHTSVVTMCNVSNANSVGLAHQIADAVIGSRFPQPVPVPPARGLAQQSITASITLSSAEAARMAGRYFSEELNATYELVQAGSGLVLRRPRAAADTLRALDHQTLRGTTMTLRFPPSTAAAAPAFTL